MEIDMVLREHLSMSIFKKLYKMASLSIVLEKPVPKMELVVRMFNYFKAEINDRIEPLTALLNKHINPSLTL
jgi:hypothetical protein